MKPRQHLRAVTALSVAAMLAGFGMLPQGAEADVGTDQDTTAAQNSTGEAGPLEDPSPDQNSEQDVPEAGEQDSSSEGIQEPPEEQVAEPANEHDDGDDPGHEGVQEQEEDSQDVTPDQQVLHRGTAAPVTPMSYADSGSGQYHEIIDWIEWGSQNNDVVLQNRSSTKTVTNTRQIGTQTLTVTCTASGLQWHQPQGTGENHSNTGTVLRPPLVAYTPGSWAGDALDDLYNVGGAGYAVSQQTYLKDPSLGDYDHNNTRPVFPRDFRNPNQMVIGLANPNPGLGNSAVDDSQTNGANMSFDFTCEADLDGTPVPLEGLVFADAEASSSANLATNNPRNGPEWVEATTDDDVTWRIIERARTCETASTIAELNGNSLRLAVDGQECAYQPNHPWPQPNKDGYGPIAIGFLEGATSARVGIQGRGYSAVAVGYILSADFGDAPESYGEAGALMQLEWDRGVVPQGDTDVSTSAFGLATHTVPTHTILGTQIDADRGHQYSPGADADDLNGIDDEDSLDNSTLAPQFEIPIDAFIDGTYTVSGIECSGPQTGQAHISGWIDWNGNGTFDETERATTTCGQGGVQDISLTWDVPADADPELSHTYMRLRIAKEATEVVDPTGISMTGEVEDYRLRLPAKLIVEKEWVVNGEYFDHEDQPDGLDADVMVDPDPDPQADWSQWQLGYRVKDSVTVGETFELDPLIARGCTLDESRLTGDGIPSAGIELDMNGSGSAAVTLPKVKNEYLITNTLTCEPGEVVWQKHDENGDRLIGSEWLLTGPGVPADTIITDCVEAPCLEGQYLDQDSTGGALKLTDLAWGDYTLTESKAPVGYERDETVHEFTIDSGSLTFDVGAIENKQREGPDLPLTGGQSAAFYSLLGGGLLTVAAGLMVWVRRRALSLN